MNQSDTLLRTEVASPIKASRGRAGLWLVVLLIVVAVLALFIGRYPTMMIMTPDRLLHDKMAQQVVLNLRLPRILTAILLGMSLSAAGTVFQMIFGNPLMEPGLMGVSQGASFGAALYIVCVGTSAWLIQANAALFGLIGMGLSYFVARRVRYGGWVLRLVLAGIAVSALFSSGLGIIEYLADPTTQLAQITFWLLGSLSSITWPPLLAIVPAVLVSLFIIYRMRWRLNLLSLSDETAFSLGATPGRERLLLLVAAVVATSAVISVSGMIHWVGLIIPHIARRISGADASHSLPTSLVLGGLFTLICDTLARTVYAGEIPLGILTSLIGALIFIILMVNNKLPVQK